MTNDPESSKSARPAPPPGSPRPGSASPTVFIDWGPALPEAYGRPRIHALVRDPRAWFCCWEGGDRIRTRDVTDGTVREHLVGGIGSWYSDGIPEHEYEVDLVSGGRVVATSNRIRLPRFDPATAVDPEWTPTPDQEEVLRRLAGTLEPAASGAEEKGDSPYWRRRIGGMPVSRPSRSS